MVGWLSILLLALGAISGYILYVTDRRDAAMAVGGILIIFGALGAFGVVNYQAIEGAPGGATPTAEEAAAIVAGLCTGAKKPIGNLTVSLQEKGSNSWSAADSTLRAYLEGTDPSGATASAIDTVTITDGNGTRTSSRLMTSTKYRIVLDGSTTYYDADLGETCIRTPETTEATPNVTIQFPNGDYPAIGAYMSVGTLVDVINEGKHSTDANSSDVNYSMNDVNELRVDSKGAPQTTDQIAYDLSDGDGTFKLRPIFEVGGSNQYAKQLAFCFDNDDTNPMEGDEFSAISIAQYTGTDYGITQQDILNTWKNEECIPLGDVVQSGTSGEYAITFTATEANITAGSDIFRMCIEDLGKIDGKDVRLGTKATKDCTTFKFIN